MADTKITALTALTAADPANDVIPIVDVSDTTMAASGTTKKISVNNILGASGTATLASATITGAATVGTTLGVTGVSTLTGAVGVGVSPITNSKLSIKSSAALPYNVALQNRNATQNWYMYVDAAAVDDQLLTINDGTSNRVVLDISGNVGIGKTPVASSGCLQLISGVNFPATQVASSDANTLDDYEEGAWVPTDGSGAGLAFTVANCRYTKVGRLVTVQGSLSYPATASGANAIWGGFPFVAADNIFLTIGYTDTPIATFTYFSGTNNSVYLLTPGVNTINSSLSLRSIVFFGTYMV